MVVAATGICVADYSETWPSPDYVDPTGMSLPLALGAILAILLASLAWVRSLKRQVIRRTAALACETRARRDAEVEFDAMGVDW